MKAVGKGRKPTPAHLRALKGGAASPPAPVLPPGDLPEPRRLSPDALAEYLRVAPLLAGIVSPADGRIVEAYASAYATWCRAQAELAAAPLVVTNARGNSLKNPLCTAVNEAQTQMIRAAAEVGLTPSARTRLAPPEAPGDKLAAFLKGPKAAHA